MGVQFRYMPPTVNAVSVVTAAAVEATRAAAAHLLDASKQLVPVDSGALRDSGRVTSDGLEAAVSYGEDGEPTGVYAIVQHERLDFHHPNGGQAKFLEQPMHAESGRIAEIIAETVRTSVRR